MQGHDNRVSCLGVSNDALSLCTGSWDSMVSTLTTKLVYDLLTILRSSAFGHNELPSTESCQLRNISSTSPPRVSVRPTEHATSHHKNGRTIQPKGMCHADYALTATQWPIFTSYSAGAESFLPRITGQKEVNLLSLVLSFFLNRTSFIMEVLCTRMCATASLYLGRGGCFDV